MLAVGLSFKFPSAEDVREAQSIPVPGQDNTPLQVADQGLFINTAAVFEGIAVEKKYCGRRHALQGSQTNTT